MKRIVLGIAAVLVVAVQTGALQPKRCKSPAKRHPGAVLARALRVAQLNRAWI